MTYIRSKFLDVEHISTNDDNFFNSKIPAELATGLDPYVYDDDIMYASNYKHVFDLILQGLRALRKIKCTNPACPITQIHFHCTNCNAPYSMKHYNTYQDLLNHPKYCKWCHQPIKYPIQMFQAITELRQIIAYGQKKHQEAEDEATYQDILDSDPKFAQEMAQYDEIDKKQKQQINSTQTNTDGIWQNGTFYPFDDKTAIGYDPTHPDDHKFADPDYKNF